MIGDFQPIHLHRLFLSTKMSAKKERTQGEVFSQTFPFCGLMACCHDPFHSRLIVWALDWDAVLDRAERALRDITVSGVKTTIPYHLEILRSAEFQSGHFNTGFVAAHPELINYSVNRSNREIAAAIGAALAASMGL